MLRFAATTFQIWPKSDNGAGATFEQKILGVFAPIKSSLFLIEEGTRRVVFLTSHFITDHNCVSILLRRAIARELGISESDVFCFSSHNHCAPRLYTKERLPFTPVNPDELDPEKELSIDGLELLRLCVKNIGILGDQLEPVNVRFGKGSERRITHNRKGRRADGSTYLMREEDRLLLGEDFTGDIDEDAFVIGFFNETRPVGFLTQFTGHPITAFHCDRPIVCAEYPQIACDDLSSFYGNVPVGFLQGCAGDTNSKGLLADIPIEQSIRRAENYGHQLGETFIKISNELKKSESHDLRWMWRSVWLPYKEVPSVHELERRLHAVDIFLKRCAAEDEFSTRECDGLNFPTNMNVSTRRLLLKPTIEWLQWALAFHRENRLWEAPKGLDLSLATIRIGDVGIVGLPGEPFLGIGRQIKKLSSLPLTVPCGYMNEGQDSFAYIPDGPNCEDMDYCSSYYRYTQAMLPFQRPAGDLLALAAVEMLKETLK